MKILLAVDGSDASTRAARHVARLSRQLAEAPALTLANVSLPLLAPAERKLGRKASAEYYESNSRHAVRSARRVLERAGLVTTQKIGRVRTCRLGLSRLEKEAAWIENYRQLWAARFDALDRIVEELKLKEKDDGPKSE